MKSIHELTANKRKSDIPSLKPGMTVKVHQKIMEGDKQRIQIFEGVILALRGGKGLHATMTVRKIASGVGVERIFPIHSPLIDKIELVKQAKVRKAKLYYLKTYQKTVKEAKLA